MVSKWSSRVMVGKETYCSSFPHRGLSLPLDLHCPVGKLLWLKNALVSNDGQQVTWYYLSTKVCATLDRILNWLGHISPIPRLGRDRHDRCLQRKLSKALRFHALQSYNLGAIVWRQFS